MTSEKTLGCFYKPAGCHGDVIVEYLETRLMTEPAYYTGVGSRETPKEVRRLMKCIAITMALHGFTLRSGGAGGADTAFEEGADEGKGKKEIYLPTRRFKGHPSPLFHIMPEAFRIAERIHPAWHRCSPFARKLHARNCHQVMGQDLVTPSEITFCWTVGGQEVGGTRTAIIFSRENQIPVANLATEAGLNIAKNFLQKLGALTTI